MSSGPPRQGEVPAICHRCGGSKKGPLVPCKVCGFVPTGEERPVAWLFSRHHLSPHELVHAAARLREGERPDLSRDLRAQAREAMGAAPLPDEARRPLSSGNLMLLALANLVASPLVGLAVWWGMGERRPVAAGQALRVTLPFVVVFALALVGDAVMRLG